MMRRLACEPAAAVVAAHNPIRVGLAVPGGFELGGIGRAMLYTSRAWSELNGAPIPVLIDARGGGTLLFLPFHLLKAVGMLTAGRITGSVDVLHLNVAGRGSTLRKLILSELAGALRLPTIVHLHDYDYGGYLDGRGRVLTCLIRRMFARARIVVVLGKRDRDTLANRLGVHAGKTFTLPNAVPDPGPPPNRATRDGACRIVFLGHLDDRKGVPELLAALAGGELRRQPWHLDLAGGGQVERFRAEVARLGLEDRVTLHGWVPVARVAELCRAADLFILPSHAEGQAMSLLEAMAHGLAIVTTPVGAHLEAVRDGTEASIVPPGDVAALAAAVARLVGDHAFRHRLGTAARRRYLADFTIDRYAARLAGLYRDALGDRIAARTDAPRPGAAASAVRARPADAAP